MSKYTPIQGAFTKGFIDDKGANKIPPQYAGYLRNARIVNSSITTRKGVKTLYTLPAPIQGISINNNKDTLVVANGQLYKNNIAVGAVTNIGKVNFVHYGKFTILLTGSIPYYYDGTTLTQVPSGNLQSSSVSGLVPSPNPVIGAALTGFTFIANTVDKSILHISKPVTPDSPQNCYDWSTYTSVNQYADVGENRVMTSNILGLIANLNYLYIFCESTIEVIQRGAVQTFNSKGFLNTTALGDGDAITNERTVCGVGDKIFYFTKNLERKTIGFVPGITYPQIGVLSNREGQSIQGRLRKNLNINQSNACMVYDKRESTVELYCASKSSTVNDLVVIYDIISDSFLVDNGKNISVSTSDNVSGLESVYLAGNNGAIYQDDAWYKDEVSSGVFNPISFEYDTINNGFGDSSMEKLMRGYTVSGGMNTQALLRFRGYVDGQLEHDRSVAWSDLYGTESGSHNVGGPDQTPDAGEVMSYFDYVANHGVFRKRGKKMRVQITSNTIDANFYLDAMAVSVMGNDKQEYSDK